MPVLNTAVALASSNYPIPNSGSPLEFDSILSVSDVDGVPVTGLMQAQVAIVLAGSLNQFPAQLVLTGSEPELDESGDPVLNEDGTPVMKQVPGPVATAGLPGFYRLSLFALRRGKSEAAS